MQGFLKLHGSSNVILIENLNQNDRNKMNNIYQPEKRKPRLLDLVSQEIQTLHYSRRTEKTYIGWIKRFILFHRKRHPVKMGEPVVIHSDIQLPRIFLKTDMISEQFKNSLRIRMFKQQWFIHMSWIEEFEEYWVLQTDWNKSTS